MAGKYGASDLGSDWVTVPRKFRGRKPTSSDTSLAYITGAEKGLLSRFAKGNQVGPDNIPSYDDSGFDPDYVPLTESQLGGNKATNYTFNWNKPGPNKGGSRTPAQIHAEIVANQKKQAPASLAVIEAKSKVKAKEHGAGATGPKKNPWLLPGPGGSTKKPTGRTGSFPSYDGSSKDDDGKKDDGGTTQTQTCASIGKTGTWPNCTPVTTGEEKCPDGQVGTPPNCKDPDVAAAECPGCDLTKNDCVNGKCTPKSTGTDDNGGDGPSLNTILKPDQTPMLQSLTNEMDLRNMLGNVLNKNNPLFKQARTRALQAMAGRGVVNSSMAEEAVMGAIMDVAIPIATRVIDDMQRVMAANVNASNAFKEALNEAYYSELIKRVDAANEWNLTRMQEGGFNWRAMLEAKGGAANISDPEVYRKYMEMLKGQPGFHLGTPTYDVAGT